MDSQNVLNVLNYFPPTRADLRFVDADWQDAMPAVGSKLKSGEKYLFAAHLAAGALPASFESIELTYSYRGEAYTTATQIRVEITDQASCANETAARSQAYGGSRTRASAADLGTHAA